MIETRAPEHVLTGEIVLKQPKGFAAADIEIPMEALKLSNAQLIDRYIVPACYAALQAVRAQLTR